MGKWAGRSLIPEFRQIFFATGILGSDAPVKNALTAGLCRPVDAVVGQAPACRAIPAARRIGALVPAQRLHELESAALEGFEQRMLRVGAAGQHALTADEVGRIEPARGEPAAGSLDQERAAARGMAGEFLARIRVRRSQ